MVAKFEIDVQKRRARFSIPARQCAPKRRLAEGLCCGSGGMFVQSEKFVKTYGGLLVDISFFGLARLKPTHS